MVHKPPQTQGLGVTGRSRQSGAIDDPRPRRDQGAAKRGDDYERPLWVAAPLGVRRKVALRFADLFFVNDRGELDIDFARLTAAQAESQVFLEKTTAYRLTLLDAAEHTIVLANFSAPSTIFLMPAVEATGYKFRVSSIGGAQVTVFPDAPDLLAGQVFQNMAPYESLLFTSTGTEWIIL